MLKHKGELDVEVFTEWLPGIWDIKKLIKEAEIIGGLAFVNLKEVLKWKRIRGKEKDKKDIEIIENYLKSN